MLAGVLRELQEVPDRIRSTRRKSLWEKSSHSLSYSQELRRTGSAIY